MKKSLFIFLSLLFLSAAPALAQLGFVEGTDMSYMNRTQKDPKQVNKGLQQDLYIGLNYSYSLSPSSNVSAGLDYKFVWGFGSAVYAPLYPEEDWFYVFEHHAALPLRYNHMVSDRFGLFAGPVFDYCFSSKTKGDEGKDVKFDNFKELGDAYKPFNVYYRGGVIFGTKLLSVDIYLQYCHDLCRNGTSRLYKLGLGFQLRVGL